MSGSAHHHHLGRVAVDASGRATLDLPPPWRVEIGPPTLATPVSWPGEPPAVVVSVEADGTSGHTLVGLVHDAALARLADPVVLHLGERDGDVEAVVAHHHRGVDVTTVERHHCRADGARWVVGFTAAHPDVPALLPLAHRVVASLVVDTP